ncbi:MAG: tRNA (guanosine(37)-N1)-methyltransferase TrmD [Nesterenkonia sp.]|uniref:tRNA (guanosine(37)-N1)-methyltransferase TrmD n=1 Tax=Nesterenkonia marinintestina TaxID=2979865 RepID=UPI0021C18D60|nr:tRNA (guanosine(37)-N1)-methyltransferase TrmD [Nesterenkonia sp. GX14115]MDO5492045.1 tRNA (guanosine(37)-N1)-methyltransferase TrmD [Nesterenkonia sp.]
MRIDLISIFPEFYDVLDLSLIGRAQQDGILDVRRHQLREHTADRHRTVDDTPTGGGAGMVMKPEPWALALDDVLAGASGRPTLIIPTPAGAVFTQRTAEDLAARDHLVFAAGRYEGIDQRVTEWAEDGFDVRPLSIGDYVLNGGEVAVIAMVEAVTRLVPGVIGNPASLDEESHSDGLLEYPVYTKPAVWRGIPVPEVLLSGDHAKIAAHRREQQMRRTRDVRPDLYARHLARRGGDLA